MIPTKSDYAVAILGGIYIPLIGRVTTRSRLNLAIAYVVDEGIASGFLAYRSYSFLGLKIIRRKGA